MPISSRRDGNRGTQPDSVRGQRDPPQGADDGAGEEKGQQRRHQHGDSHGDGQRAPLLAHGPREIAVVDGEQQQAAIVQRRSDRKDGRQIGCVAHFVSGFPACFCLP
jgi:hypothetical protein